MKKLVLGLTLTFFLGAYSASALTNFDNPPKDKAKKETKAEAKTDKKECTNTTAENKGCCKDKATAGTEGKCCKSKSSETASTK